MKTSTTPAKISLHSKNQLSIEWKDGQTHSVSLAELRKVCPCATCKEERSSKRGLTSSPLAIIDSSAEEQSTIEQIWQVGNYALGIRWKDGHDSGIYTYTYLRELNSAEE